MCCEWEILPSQLVRLIKTPPPLNHCHLCACLMSLFQSSPQPINPLQSPLQHMSPNFLRWRSCLSSLLLDMLPSELLDMTFPPEFSAPDCSPESHVTEFKQESSSPSSPLVLSNPPLSPESPLFLLVRPALLHLCWFQPALLHILSPRKVRPTLLHQRPPVFVPPESLLTCKHFFPIQYKHQSNHCCLNCVLPTIG